MFGVLYAADGTPRDTLEAVAREFSPRIEVYGAREIALDLTGLERLFGDARTIADELRRTAADRGLRVRVAIASTRAAARLLVRHRAGITVVVPGTEAGALAPLPLALLGALAELPTSNSRRRTHEVASAAPTLPLLDTLRHWGLRTLGELAALDADEVAARLGQDGVTWQRLARGDDARPLVPALPEERFEQSLDLDWPIDGLEPLSFVLARLMEPLEAHLERRDRGAAVLHVRLHLVTRLVHARSLHLPAPMRDARALRTLALLDLESHPPDAAIDRVVVAVDPTPGRVVQFSLLTRALPTPERLSTLMARLAAVMGEGRCGSPAPIDTWQPGAFAMVPFAPSDATVVHSADEPRPSTMLGASRPFDRLRVAPTRRHAQGRPDPSTRSRRAENSSDAGGATRSIVMDADVHSDVFRRFRVSAIPRFGVVADGSDGPIAALRRFRTPVPARVRMEDGRPVRVTVDRRGFGGGQVDAAAGPWRTSGAWWRDDAWERDEWDVSSRDGTTYRIFRERDTDRWFVEGIID